MVSNHDWSCELSLRCCKSQQGPVDEKPLLLDAEPSTQPHEHDINSSKVGIVDPKFIFTPAPMIQKKKNRLITSDTDLNLVP